MGEGFGCHLQTTKSRSTYLIFSMYEVQPRDLASGDLYVLGAEVDLDSALKPLVFSVPTPNLRFTEMQIERPHTLSQQLHAYCHQVSVPKSTYANESKHFQQKGHCLSGHQDIQEQGVCPSLYCSCLSQACSNSGWSWVTKVSATITWNILRRLSRLSWIYHPAAAVQIVVCSSTLNYQCVD